MGRSCTGVLYLVGCKGQIEGGPSVLDSLEAVLNGQLLAGSVNNLAAGVHVLMQAQLHQVSQAEVVAHREVDARRLHIVHSHAVPGHTDLL